MKQSFRIHFIILGPVRFRQFFRDIRFYIMTIQGKGKKEYTYDAIVVGSGISGGWAAKELCEAGLKTLVLERGRMVRHREDYPTAVLPPWEMQHRGQLRESVRRENPIVSRCYAFDETTEHFFVKDKEQPYIQEKPFDWIRGYQVGGKSLTWARQTQRWSRYEFEAPARDGFAIDWPVRYEDLAPWYSHVEKFAGISGRYEGIDNLPDSEFLPAFDLNCVEEHIRKKIKEHYTDRQVINGRCAHVTEPQEIHQQQGRVCLSRNMCYRGCPFGGYFSSNSTTLPWAEKTENLTIRPFSVVESILYDEDSRKAVGVRVVDAEEKTTTEFFARVIFVNGSTLNSNILLLNSKSRRFPDGLGNDSGVLGRYIAFHNYRGNISAVMEGFEDRYYYGRRPTTAFMPAFRNVRQQETDFLRGYMVAFSASRSGWQRGQSMGGIGVGLKNKISEPGPWSVFMMMQGETIPKYENHIRLSEEKKDQWGIPQMIISVDYDENDEKMLKDFLEQGVEMLEKSGATHIRSRDTQQAPGLDIHEVGGIRMGNDPESSVLNKWNQVHACKNVFVTDGACMVSTGNQNPSLTFMALTARAAHHAIRELKSDNL